MKVLFLLLQMAPEGRSGGMYVDLAEHFMKNGCDVTIIAPDNQHKSDSFGIERQMKILRVASRPTQEVTNMIVKGFALATMSYFYKRAYKKYLNKEKFDLILMPTPPITLTNFALYVKRKTAAKFYLILRDIHPQSISSLGILRNKFMYKYLDIISRKCYKYADYIGCMSEGNINYIKENNPDIDDSKLLLLYNWVTNMPPIEESDKYNVRKKYGLLDKIVILYGGNLGLGQRIENIVDLAEHYINRVEIKFVIIGRGIEKERMRKLVNEYSLHNVIFVDFMPQNDYLAFVASVDIGLVSINEKYAVPTCPSKAISYMASGIPVFAMINPNNDYGYMIENAGAGYWAVGSDKKSVYAKFNAMISDENLRKNMGKCGQVFYETNCTPHVAYQTIINQIK